VLGHSASGAASSSGDGVRAELTRPAFYALRSGGWRDYVTLLHVPYTAWHLSYVAIGAALSPSFAVSRLWPALVAFGLAVGIGAHALDELNGRPLSTRIPYNLEWFSGRFHGDLWFAIDWGAFPLLTAYFATAETIDATAVAGAVFACASSLAQRRLSTPVRDVRRRVTRVSGTVERRDGSVQPLGAADLVTPAEAALGAFTVAIVALAVAVVIMRL
jgi:hypothetical protein